MDGLRRLRNRVYGTVVPTLQRAVAKDLDELIHELISEAASLWASTNWLRFDDKEISCSMQLYRWGVEARRLSSALGLLSLQLEWVLPTPGMLSGSEDASTMRRPDLRVEIGDTGRIIECKRLSLRNGHPRAYVYEGMERFVAGAYNSGGDEYMVAFLQRDNIVDVVDAVNDQISQHRLMGVGQAISVVGEISLVLHRGISHHVRADRSSLAINHYMLDLCVSA